MKNQKTLTSRRELLESTKLSRLPSLPKRAVFNSKNTCAGCRVELTEAIKRLRV